MSCGEIFIMSSYTKQNGPLLVETVSDILTSADRLCECVFLNDLIPTDVPLLKKLYLQRIQFSFLMFCIICSRYDGVDLLETLVVHDSSRERNTHFLTLTLSHVMLYAKPE